MTYQILTSKSTSYFDQYYFSSKLIWYPCIWYIYNLFTCGIFYNHLDHWEISHSTVQPLSNNTGTTAIGLDAPFANDLSPIRMWCRIWQSLTRHNRCWWKTFLWQKGSPSKNDQSAKSPPPVNDPPLPQTVFPS